MGWAGVNMEKYLENRPCRKCGDIHATSKFLLAYSGIETSLSVPERIRRTCVRCQFQWDEAPMDDKTARIWNEKALEKN